MYPMGSEGLIRLVFTLPSCRHRSQHLSSRKLFSKPSIELCSSARNTQISVKHLGLASRCVQLYNQSAGSSGRAAHTPLLSNSQTTGSDDESFGKVALVNCFNSVESVSWEILRLPLLEGSGETENNSFSRNGAHILLLISSCSSAIYFPPPCFGGSDGETIAFGHRPRRLCHVCEINNPLRNQPIRKNNSNSCSENISDTLTREVRCGSVWITMIILATFEYRTNSSCEIKT